MRLKVLLLGLMALSFPAETMAMSENTPSETLMANAMDQNVIVGPLVKQTSIQSHGDVKYTIEQQLRTIRERDDRTAFMLSTAEFSDDFKTPQDYMRALRHKKPSLYNHVHYEILPGGLDDKFRKVKLIDKRGQEALAMFKMVHDSQGNWRVDKVLVLKTDQDPI